MITNQQIIDLINKKTENDPLLYITRNKQRALGIEKLLTNYKIITASPLKDTAEIIEKTVIPKGMAVVFKNNSKIQRLTAKKGIKLLNPDFCLVEKYENKISQYQWLKKIIPEYLPETIIGLPKSFLFNNIKKKLGGSFICQFNRSHSGEGTQIIENKKDWEKLKKKFPQRPLRLSKLISGETFTLNVCIWEKCILLGNPSYQITGLQEFTDLPFATIGNDWSYANKNLSKKDLESIKKITEKISNVMIKDEWKGLFGIDFIREKENWFVVEINARQPASVNLETILQQKQGNGLTTMTAHLAALLDIPLPTDNPKIQKINQGAQILIRRKNGQNSAEFKKLLSIPAQEWICDKRKMGTVPIENEVICSIQKERGGFIKQHNQWNSDAQKIIKILEK
ncbi:hypothetical protein B6D52_00955 [Candidatus Parcubacteria bacterium 4484_255]|nr:MAG: hypothetical protein B6D52_00955 [Candidatus Parcubacteria bacterium 4484_255]